MTASSDRLLRRTLWGNAAFSVISGATLAIFAGPFAGRPPMRLCRSWASTSPSCSSCWAWASWPSARSAPGLPRARRCRRAGRALIFAADIAWVAGSVLVLALPASWTTAGIAGIVVLALIVADLAILEYLGLRRLSAAH